MLLSALPRNGHEENRHHLLSPLDPAAELRLQHRHSSWGVPTELTLRLLNGYGLVDPFVWQVRESNDDRLRWSVTFDAPPLFPLYPVLSMSVRF